MVYSPHAPYEVMQTNYVDFPTMQRLRRFSRYWDLVANSGNFVESAPLLWCGGASPFARFMELSDRLFERFRQAHGIALNDLAEFLFRHLTARRELDPNHVARPMWRDYQRGGRVDCPGFLREYVPEPERRVLRAQSFERTVLPRQSRHTHR